jgi:hypothetical protein
VHTKDRLEMLVLLLQGLTNNLQQCPALVASLSQQVVAFVNQTAGNAELLPLLLQALLLALLATVSSIAAEPASVDMHVGVWQHAQDTMQVRPGNILISRSRACACTVGCMLWMQSVLGPDVHWCHCALSSLVLLPATDPHHKMCAQGLNNIFCQSSSNSSSGGSPAPAGLWAATAASWLAATRLMGWSGSSALNNATAQVQHACSNSSGGSAGGSSATAGVLLLPVLSVLQHMHFSHTKGAFLPAGAAVAAAAANRPKGAAAAAAAASAAGCGDLEDAVMLDSQQHGMHDVVLDSFMQGCDAAVVASSQAPAVHLAALIATSQLLQLHALGATAAGFAGLVQDAVQRITDLCCGPAVRDSKEDGSSVVGLLGEFVAPCLVPAQQGSTSSTTQLPPLQQLLPVLEPALQATEQPMLQAAAMHLLSSYLEVVSTPTLLYGAQEALLDALTLLIAKDATVRAAALGLVQQYLQPHVLVAVCGGEQTAEDAVAAATQAAAEFQELAVAVATQPQRRLLKHLQDLLATCSMRVAGADGLVVAKTALMRAMAGLFAGLLGSGCEDIPLLQLLQQINDDNAQVSYCGNLQRLAADGLYSHA